MATEVIKYRIKCDQDEVFITDYLDTKPTVCENTHSIVEWTTIDSVSVNTVATIDDVGSTEGFYVADNFDMEVVGPTGAVSEYNVEYPYEVMIYSVVLNPSEDNVGDKVFFCTAPDTTLGIITESITGVTGPTGTYIDVNSTVTDNIKKGWLVKLDNAGDTESLGKVSGYYGDSGYAGPTGSIGVTSHPTKNFPIGSLVKISVPRLCNVEIRSANPLFFGMANQGGSKAPAGTKGVIHYTNRNGQDKKFAFAIEIKY